MNRETYIFRGIECPIPELKELLDRSVRDWKKRYPGQMPCPIFNYHSTNIDLCGIEINVRQATIIITPMP